MTRSSPQRRRLPATDLYGITHAPRSRGRSNPETVRLMLAVGIRIIQYREKDLPPRRMLEECLAIRRLCDDHGACFIVNDRPDLALLCGADGLHLGQDDLPLSRVRQLVGEEMILGLSTHAPEQARPPPKPRPPGPTPPPDSPAPPGSPPRPRNRAATVPQMPRR